MLPTKTNSSQMHEVLVGKDGRLMSTQELINWLPASAAEETALVDAVGQTYTNQHNSSSVGWLNAERITSVPKREQDRVLLINWIRESAVVVEDSQASTLSTQGTQGSQ